MRPPGKEDSEKLTNVAQDGVFVIVQPQKSQGQVKGGNGGPVTSSSKALLTVCLEAVYTIWSQEDSV